MNRNLKTLLATGLISMVGVCALAQATDNFAPTVGIMTGAQCQPSNGTQWADFIVNPDGIRNINPTYNRYVSCTIPIGSRQPVNQTDTDPLTAAGKLVIFLSFDYSQVPATGNTTTTCTFFKQTNTAVTTESINIIAPRTTSLVSYGSIPAIFNGLYPDSLQAVGLNCRLPKKVKLAQIYWRDEGRTDGYTYTP